MLFNDSGRGDWECANNIIGDRVGTCNYYSLSYAPEFEICNIYAITNNIPSHRLEQINKIVSQKC